MPFTLQGYTGFTLKLFAQNKEVFLMLKSKISGTLLQLDPDHI